ncbi:MAG: ABC transporter permease [Halobacteriaceae archaeon]
MSALVVASRTWIDARTGTLTVLSVVSMLGFAAAVWLAQGAQEPTPTAPVLAALVSSLVPLAALIFSHESVAYERERSTVRLLMTLPHTRRDVVLGHFLGQLAVLGVALALSLATGTLAGLAVGAPTSVLGIGSLFGVGTVLTATYGGIAVGVSASTDSTSRAFAGALLLAGLSLAWGGVVGTVRRTLVDLGLPDGPVSVWTALGRLGPTTALRDLLGAVPLDRSVAGSATPGDAALGVVVLAAWAAVPLAVGSWRFERADL